MKNLTLIIITLLAVVGLNAQDSTSVADTSMTTISSQKDKPNYESKSLFGSGKLVGGFGALSVKGTTIDGKETMAMGIKGAFVLNHNFNIGIAGYGFLSPVKLSAVDSIDYAGGYGGLFVEPVIWSDKVVHLAVPIIVGGGGIANTITNTPYGYNDQYYQDASGYFVFEPGLMVEINMIKNMRLDIGGTYRWTYGLALPGVESDILNDWSLEFAIKIGAF